jgi:hypothetical protein
MMKEKAVCLFLITASQEATPMEAHILFANLREVNEVPPPPDTVFFYDGYGRKDLAKSIYEYKSGKLIFRQWFGICNAERAEELRQHIFSREQFNIGSLHTVFSADCEIVKDEDWERDDEYRIMGLPLYSGYQTNRYRYNNYVLFDTTNFPAYCGDLVTNLQAGKDHASYLHALFPFGYIEARSLQQHLSENIILLDERLVFSGTFHGERFSTNGKTVDPKKFIGFIQYAPIDRGRLSIAIVDDSSPLPKIEDSKSVDDDTGIWILETDMPIGKGILVVFDKETSEIIAGQRFVLIRNIDFNIEIQTGNYIDLFGSSHPFSQEKQLKVNSFTAPPDKTFFRESFPFLSDTQYSITLSDYWKSLLLYCSPCLLICDPYMFGEFKLSGDKVELNAGQTAFLNAIWQALFETRFEEILVLGMHHRTKDYWPDPMSMPEPYTKIFSSLNRIQQTKFKFRNSASAFHDRRIIKLANDTSPLTPAGILDISTSISGIIKEGELRVTKLPDASGNIIAHRVFKMWRDASLFEVEI